MRPAIVLIAALLILSACNDSDRPKDQQDKQASVQQTPPSATCNYEVKSSEADAMIKAFNKDIGGELKIKRHFWISACTLSALDAQLNNATSKFDGVRFFATDAPNSQDSSTLHMTLTTLNEAPPSNFRHFNRWQDEFIDGGCTGSEIIYNVKNEPIDEMGEFYKRYRSNNPNISRGIWVDRCVIRKLHTVVSDPSNGLDGMKLIAAAYTADIRPDHSRVGNSTDMQSTYILIPTKKGGSGHEPDWNVIEKSTASDGYNHSQLCPQICN